MENEMKAKAMKMVRNAFAAACVVWDDEELSQGCLREGLAYAKAYVHIGLLTRVEVIQLEETVKKEYGITD